MAAANITNTVYDITNATSSENILEFVQDVNAMTGQWFMLGVLLVGFIVLFVSMMDNGKKEAFVGSGFITVILAMFFTTLNFISVSVMLLITVPVGVILTVFLLRG